MEVGGKREGRGREGGRVGGKREGGKREMGGKREEREREGGGMHVNTSDYAAQSDPGPNLSSFLRPPRKRLLSS